MLVLECSILYANFAGLREKFMPLRYFSFNSVEYSCKEVYRSFSPDGRKVKNSNGKSCENHALGLV